MIFGCDDVTGWSDVAMVALIFLFILAFFALMLWADR